MRVHGQVELGQRVQAVSVTAELGDEHLGLEGADEWWHDGVEGSQPAGGPGMRR